MENTGKEPSVNHGSLTALVIRQQSENGHLHAAQRQKFNDTFHTFVIEWSTTSITFFVDGTGTTLLRPRIFPLVSSGFSITRSSFC